MPLYEYECDVCRATFEVIQRFSDPPIEKCRVCGGPVHKVLSAPAIQFKGTGWYVTDYAKRGGSDAGKKSEPGSTGSTSEPTKSTESSSSTSTAKDSGSSEKK